MRKILFRAKVKDKEEMIGKGFPVNGTVNPISEWVYGVPIPRYPDLFLAWSDGNGEYEEITVVPETVGQYTGMTDKHGVKIFDGDILMGHLDKELPEEETRLEIVWHNNGWYGRSADFGQTFYDDFDRGFEKLFEVIGNIHDNPELMEG